MKVRTRTLAAGPRGVEQAGAVIDLPKAEAYAWIEGGFASQYEPAEVETAAVEQPEAAVKGRGRPRGRKRKG